MTLVYISGAWLVGIFLGSKFDLSAALAAIGLAPLAVLIFRRGNTRAVILSTICLITFLGAALYFPLRLPATDKSTISFYHEQAGTTLKGLVSSQPETGGQQTQLRFTAQEIKIADRWQEISGTALVYVPAYSEYRYGDRLLLSGQPQTPPRFDDFDYRDYLAHQGISTIIFYPRIEILSRDQGSRILGWVYGLRSNLGQALARALPEPQASLAQGITLGLRGNIPPELNQNFSRTGTTHVLAISGLNLSIIAGIFLSLGLWLFGRRHYFYVWLALGSIWGYALITGLEAPVVRGAIMASLFLVGEMLGRQRSAITALALAAALMVALDPQVLWTVSFQMSFLAMAGLMAVFPRLQALGRKAVKARLGDSGRVVSGANFLSDSFSVSLAAILTTWPLTAYYFGIIAFTGLLANLLALPALPGIIVTGALTSVIGLIAPVAAQATGWLAWLFLSYLVLVVNAFAAWPGSALQAGAGSALLVWGYYPVLAALLWLSSRRSLTGAITRACVSLKTAISGVNIRVAKWAVPPLLVAAILLSLAAATMPDKKLRISVLDVGQGEAILVQTPARQDILIDGGPDPQAVIRELGRKMPFWDRTIDLSMVTA
ncbi:MAG: ComEC/Rec2 family competence protein [Chloroflexota bacterium]